MTRFEATARKPQSEKVRPSKNPKASIFLSETGRRYYSSELGRWINRDPIGEQGGLNIYGFVGNGAVHSFDFIGFWKWENDGRGGKARAVIIYEDGDSISSAAEFARLEPSESEKWLYNETAKEWVDTGDDISPECSYSIPNTVYITKGDVEGKWLPIKEWYSLVNLYVSLEIRTYKKEMESRGYRVVYDDKATASDIKNYLGKDDAYGWFFGGHGVEGVLFTSPSGGSEYEDGVLASAAAENLHHSLGFVTLYACEAAREDDWINLISQYGIFRASEKKIRPATTGWSELPAVSK